MKKKTLKNKEPEIFCGYTKICDVNELKENPLNPNKHPKYQLERLAEIIKSNGWRQPITISDLSGLIVKGHGRYNAAKLAGFEKIPVEIQHYESKEAETADLIADNYVAELSEVKSDSLESLVREIGEADPEKIGALGLSVDEVQTLIAEPKEIEDIPNALPLERERVPFQQAKKLMRFGALEILLRDDEIERFDSFWIAYTAKEVDGSNGIMELLLNGDKNFKWTK